MARTPAGYTPTQTDFTGGEISPAIAGRIDQKFYGKSVARCRDMIPHIQGGVFRRMGTLDDGPTATPNKKAMTVSFVPTIGESYDLEFSHYGIRITKESTLVPLTVPGTDAYTLLSPYSEADIESLYFLPLVDTIQIYHPKYPTKVLRRKSVGTTEDWDLIDFEFVDGPYEDFDDTDTQLTVSSPTLILKLTRTGAFTGAAVGDYVEYRKKNQWYLGKVLGTASTPAAPSNPTVDVVYIQPVSSIVRDVASEVMFYYWPAGSYDGLSTSGTVHNEVRANQKLLNGGLIDSWIRFSDEKAAGATKWCQILDYTGLIDYPTEFLTNPTYAALTIGNTYKIIQWSGGYIITDSSSGYHADNVGETFTLGAGYDVSSPVMAISNLSSKKQYDTVRVATPVTFISVSNPVVEETYLNTATVEASAAIFSASRDVGRFLRFVLDTKSVSCKITSVVTTSKVTVSLLSSLPYKKNVDELLDNGITTKWRFGAVYTGNYVACGLVYENRHIVAGIPSLPDIGFASETSKYNAYAPSDEDSEVQDTSGFKLSFEGDTLPQITWLSNAIALLAGTASAVHQVRVSQTTQTLSAKSPGRPTRDSAIGSLLRPVLVGTSLILASRSGLKLNEFSSNYEVDGFDATPANTVAEHILKQNGGIKCFAYQESPNSILWFVHNNGTVSTLTYDRKQGVYAWAVHSLGGGAEVKWVSITAAADGTYDRVTFVVARDGLLRREHLAKDFVAESGGTYRTGMIYYDGSKLLTPADCVLDGGRYYLTGLSRYEGKEVGICVDGGCYAPAVVASGRVSIPRAVASWAVVGFSYSSYVRPNRTVTERTTGTSAGEVYKVSELSLLLSDTCGMAIGQVGKDAVTQPFLLTSSVMDAPPPFVSDYYKANIDIDSSVSPYYDITSELGYPLNILSITPTIVYT